MDSLKQPHHDSGLTPDYPALTLEQGQEQFLRSLEGKNRSQATARAYRCDLTQFVAWLHENNAIITDPSAIERADVTDYLVSLGERELTGVSRARKLAAIREYFRFLTDARLIRESPVEGIATPRKEKRSRTCLRTDEYTRMLSLAGGNPRDYAILQVFLQTGLRVSELCSLAIPDLDLEGRMLQVRSGKGMADREIELEKKVIAALRNWLTVRPAAPSDRVFLNYQGEPISDRGVRKLVVAYRDRAGITKRASCHSLRHTFATYKAEQGVSPFQLQEWLGHSSLATTQIYVHLGRQNARKVMEATSL